MKAGTLYAGSVVTFSLEVRDRNGRLYDASNGSVALTVHPVDEYGTVGEPIAEGIAETDGSDGIFYYDLDTAALAMPPGKYLLRLLLPYGNGKVIWQETFILSDPDRTAE